MIENEKASYGKLPVRVKLINDGENGNPEFKATMPTYGSERAAGMDLYSIQATILEPGVPMLVKTGLKMQIPEGTELQIRPRSGIAISDGITVLNTPGTVDEDYRGEIGVILYWTGANTTMNKFEVITTNSGRSGLYIPAGTRIAQAVLTPVYGADVVELIEVDELNSTERGEGGFGHTGIK